MVYEKNNCPDCNKPMGQRRYKMHVTGICINRECASFKKKRDWTLSLADFLDLKPYSNKEFLALPDNTPVWIEYRPSQGRFSCIADILVRQFDLQAWFLREEPLTLDSYGIDWRVWPTFKTFRPDEYELEYHPWRK